MRKNLPGVFFVLTFLLAVSNNAAAQWHEMQHGAKYDKGFWIDATADGGFIVAAITGAEGGNWKEAWVIKLTASGCRQWEQCFGATADEYLFCIQQMSDLNYIATGTTYSSGAGGGDVWLVKFSRMGRRIWTRAFGGEGEGCGYCVRQTNDGGYIITGRTEAEDKKQLCLIKTDATGNFKWERLFSGESEATGFDVHETADGGYIIAGYKDMPGATDYNAWLIKTDARGYTQWEKSFGGESNDCGRSVQQAGDGYLIAGWTESFGAGTSDIYLVKTDAKGNRKWEKTIGGDDYDYAHSIHGAGGGYIIAGATDSFTEGGGTGVWLVATDHGGNRRWDKVFEGAGKLIGYSVDQTLDGGFVVAGFTEGSDVGCDRWDDVLVIRTKSNGVTLWDRALDIVEPPCPEYRGGPCGIKGCRSETMGNPVSMSVKSLPEGEMDDIPGDTIEEMGSGYVDIYEPPEPRTRLTPEQLKKEVAALLRKEWIEDQRLHMGKKRKVPCVILCKNMGEGNKEKYCVGAGKTIIKYDIESVKRIETFKQDQIIQNLNARRKIKSLKSDLTAKQRRVCDRMIREMSRRCVAYAPSLPDTCLIKFSKSKKTGEQTAVLEINDIKHTVKKGGRIGKYTVTKIDTETESIVVRRGEKGRELRVWHKEWYKYPLDNENSERGKPAKKGGRPGKKTAGTAVRTTP